jgi:DNA-binding CsgD family transcriptional regulator
MALALSCEGLVVDAQPDVYLLVDAPWGWATSSRVPVALEGAIVITDNPCPEYRLDLLDERPAALLSKASLSDITQVLSRLSDASHPAMRSTLVSPLTPMERIVLKLSAKGLTNKVIARRQGIGEQRVKNLLQSIYQKLKLRSRVQLAHYYYGNWHVLEDWGPPPHSRY